MDNEIIYDALKYPLTFIGIFGGIFLGLLPPDGWQWFSWHPFLSFIAVVVMIIAILAKKVGGKRYTRLHGYLMALSGVLFMLGLYVIVWNKMNRGKRHFRTLHGRVGIITVICFVALTIGSMWYLNPDTGTRRGNLQLRWFHKLGGQILLPLSWAACITGTFHFNPPVSVWIVALGLMSVATYLCLGR